MCLCLFTGGHVQGPGHPTFPVQGWSPGPLSYRASGPFPSLYRTPVLITSLNWAQPSPSMFKLVHHGTHCTGTPAHVQTCPIWTSLYSPLPEMFKHFHYEARTVGKRVVDIRLKCLLVYIVITVRNEVGAR